MLFFFISAEVNAQCCSAGSPSGSAAFAGLVKEKNLRVSTFGRYTESQHYYAGDTLKDAFGIYKRSSYMFSGLSLGYGITRRLSVENELGYFIFKKQEFKQVDYTNKLSGFTNGAIILKYGIVQNDSLQTELTVAGGIRYPFKREQIMVDNVIMPFDLQPSSMAFGWVAQMYARKKIKSAKLSILLHARYDANFKSKSKYQYGDKARLSLVVTRNLGKNFAVSVLLRGEVTQPDRDFNYSKPTVLHTGSTVAYAAPQLVYALKRKWYFTLAPEMPVYRNYTGTQLSNLFSVQLGVTRDFSLTKNQLKEF